MKIATYNIWDSDVGMPMRFHQLIAEIIRINADIICLQEVSDRKKHDSCSKFCRYEYSHWQTQTGLSIGQWISIEKKVERIINMSRQIRTSAKVIIIQNGKLLAIKLNDCKEEWYILPGGGQDSEEMLPWTVEREVREECSGIYH